MVSYGRSEFSCRALEESIRKTLSRAATTKVNQGLSIARKRQEMHLELQWHVEQNLMKSAELLLFNCKLQEELLLNKSLKQQINILQQQIENHKALVGPFDYFIPQSGKYI